MSDHRRIQSDQSAQTAAEYVDAIVKHDADMAAQPAKPYRVRRSVAPLLAVLIPVLIGLTSFNVYSAMRSPSVFDDSEREAAVYFTMMLARTDIEAFRDSTGAFPDSLPMWGLGDLGIEYTPLEQGYELRASVGDSVITYRRGGDMSTIETAFESLAELSR